MIYTNSGRVLYITYEYIYLYSARVCVRVSIIDNYIKKTYLRLE